MGLTRGARDVGVAIAVLALTGIVVLRVSGEGGESVAGIARAVDGDTLTLGRHRVRLLGMDAPELAQACRRDDAEWRCGAASRGRLAAFLREGPVTCAPRGTDRYGRLLARCETAGGDLGGRLVREGLAVAYGGYEDEEALARAERAGLWGADFEQPQEWRRLAGRPAEDRHPAEPGLLDRLAGLLGLE